MVRLEFYGLARLRARRAELRTEATTVGAALAAADAACPELCALRDNRLSPEYRLSVGGRHFTEDLAEALAEGVALIVLGADAGG